jgi:uncharacterized membrane protein YphA (DoxX/SURF4 family)
MSGLYPNDASMLDSIGRLLIVALFLSLGLRNLTRWQTEDHVTRLGLNGCPAPRVAFWLGTAIELTGCALVLLDWHPAIGVICLLIFTVVASSLMHRLWETADTGKRMSQMNGLFANVAVVGGLLLLLQNVR